MAILSQVFALCFLFCLGACLGSFVNVLIMRLPREISLIYPRRSYCFSCHKTLTWKENIPVFSAMIQKFRCFHCGQRFSQRYFWVELMSGIFSVWAYFNSSSSLFFALHLCLFCLFVAHFFIDVDFQILPNEINALLLCLFILEGFLLKKQPIFMGAGFLMGLGLPLGVATIFKKIKNKDGLGMGDIKLYAVLGITFGPLGIIHTLFYSCLLGALFFALLLSFKKIERESPIAFGPFILVVAFIQYFFPKFFSSINFLGVY